jgi:hypothetical protein
VETAQSVISDILQEVLIQGAEQATRSVDFQTALRYMNRFMAEEDAMGTKLGWTNVVNASDPITIPSGAINGLIYNVALQIATSYDINVNPLLFEKAKKSLNVMRVIGNVPPMASYPSTMPIGSGSDYDSNGYNFYDGCCEDDPASCVSE